ncbi:hypothetical protein ABB37_01823 [Leptomonas pyrrhocoris]|uniref:Transmembrane protein n=1 Tax=Leptomonas pyrrhocoris TaxID=157538 RepID=A0A0M9G9L0_LEPPY|nr:hypothetical protein ABB37_01823 [Leptomonas pyrrhocoris]KPA85557.1 hypothetical protein ABB37_01823 [Leptomonas pyrrhocoris]|eukprot:XP_015663996.1 hypothetical protein ABB37_01823 [Leptomonas pyrrhocoris]
MRGGVPLLSPFFFWEEGAFTSFVARGQRRILFSRKLHNSYAPKGCVMRHAPLNLFISFSCKAVTPRCIVALLSRLTRVVLPSPPPISLFSLTVAIALLFHCGLYRLVDLLLFFLYLFLWLSRTKRGRRETMRRAIRLPSCCSSLFQ